MKKFLLSCFIALGVGVSAQYDFTENFESDMVGAIQFGGGGLNTTNYCSAATSGSLTYSSSVTQTGWLVRLDEAGDFYGQTNNGQKIDVTFSYKKAAGLTGTLYVAYAELDEESNLWSIVTFGSGTVLTTGASLTTCGTVTATIPAATLNPNKIYALGTWMARTGSTTGALYIDDIVVKQTVPATVPNCSPFTYPTAGSSIAAGTVGFTWTALDNASGYKITIGTSAGASDVVNTTALGNKLDVSLLPNTTYFAKIVPTNGVGDAVGCQEITFTTNSNVAHCGPLTSSAPTAIAPIKSVNFSGTTYTSDPTATTIGTFAPHQDFTTSEFIVKNDVTTLPLTVSGTTNGNTANGWAMSVFIDWNNDGDFDDVGETYFNTFASKVYVGGVTANPVTLTGNIAIPAGTAVGKKFMRVKYNYQSPAATTLNPALLTACANMINGQTEDYTIDYQEALAVSDLNKNKLSVYPNPFHDVLKISDVKGVKSVSVSDISGRQVKSLAPSAELNLSSLKAGLYIVNLQMEDGSVKSFKAIKN